MKVIGFTPLPVEKVYDIRGLTKREMEILQYYVFGMAVTVSHETHARLRTRGGVSEGEIKELLLRLYEAASKAEIELI